MIISFDDYEVTPRYDDTPWTKIRILEGEAKDGPWTTIDEFDIVPLDPDPSSPSPKSFTTDQATLQSGWYLVQFFDEANNQLDTEPVFNPQTIEILASTGDVNANLDGKVIEATSQNSNLIQVSVARVVKAYLSKVVDAETMATWVSPDTTPEIIREVAGKMIAAQVYFNHIIKTSALIDDVHYTQRLYTQAMDILNKIIAGEIDIGQGTPVVPVGSMTMLDFYPVDDTDRAFTLGMEL